MADDDLASSHESSRKRSAEERSLAIESKSRSGSVSEEQIDRNLRARFSVTRDPSEFMASPAGYPPSVLPSRDQQLLELSRLQRLRDLQLLAAARETTQLQPQLGLNFHPRLGGNASTDEFLPNSSSNFGLSLEQQLNMHQSSGRGSLAIRDILRGNVQSASYPLFPGPSDVSRLARSGVDTHGVRSPAVNDYMDLLSQLRQQEQLNERLVLEAQRRELQQQQLYRQERGIAPESILPAATSATSTRVPRTKKKLPSQQQLPMEVASNYKPGIPLELPSDKEKLTTYQALIRASLEYFKATEDDINTTVQGRRQKLQSGQIGIRCKFCAHLPLGHLLRGKGSSSYPKTKISVYQAAQNIASAHLAKPCSFMPEEMQEQMETERLKKGASKAGQNYWVKACDELGFVERDGGLWQDGDYHDTEKRDEPKKHSQTDELQSPGKERK